MAAREDESGKTVDEAVAGTMQDVNLMWFIKNALEDTDFKYQLVGKIIKIKCLLCMNVKTAMLIHLS